MLPLEVNNKDTIEPSTKEIFAIKLSDGKELVLIGLIDSTEIESGTDSTKVQNKSITWEAWAIILPTDHSGSSLWEGVKAIVLIL